MSREDVYLRLNKVFKNVFDDEEIEVCDTTMVDDIEDWDSFEHINLVVAAEQEFNIKFNKKEAKNFRNVGEMVDTIVEKTDNAVRG